MKMDGRSLCRIERAATSSPRRCRPPESSIRASTREISSKDAAVRRAGLHKSVYYKPDYLPCEEFPRKGNQMTTERDEVSGRCIPGSRCRSPPSALSVQSDEVGGDRNESETILTDQSRLPQRPRHRARPTPCRRNFCEPLAYHPTAFRRPPK